MKGSINKRVKSSYLKVIKLSFIFSSLSPKFSMSSLMHLPLYMQRWVALSLSLHTFGCHFYIYKGMPFLPQLVSPHFPLSKALPSRYLSEMTSNSLQKFSGK